MLTIDEEIQNDFKYFMLEINILPVLFALFLAMILVCWWKITQTDGTQKAGISRFW